MKQNFMDQFYTIDQETGEYIIEISLQNYDDVFNTWDSSVYNIRDLDSSLKSFLEECSYDIDSKRSIKLRFNMNNQNKDEKMEALIAEGIRNYFQYSHYIMKKRFSEKRKRSIIYIILSLLFTIVSYFFKAANESELVGEIISLSLTVGGWVFLWETFSLLFIQSSDLRKQKKQFRRIFTAPILFRYVDQSKK
ncbi:hypothetical protein GWK91_15500 [Virgibacillus sp. MSP4-1]|uniref:hypothetical protein n=1 Tax=Virgibacillus sp. MSP4-1 TaxID=2700081 RepID=UPI00039D23B1|nr:hypothetical protein [Virgibacillus sp. MSP4-1]QHS24215.1 hypothetical protein GWK91_15500 [Virgibacillus sp. MSP4-1]